MTKKTAFTSADRYLWYSTKSFSMTNITHAGILSQEARKLGLAVRKEKGIQDGLRHIISSKDKMFVITKDNFYPDTQRWLPKLFNDKILTQKLLKQKNYSVVHTKIIKPLDYPSKKEFLAYVANIKVTFPSVIKPNDGLKGRDVSLITNQRELIAACNRLYTNKKKLLLQPVVWDDEYRITFIASKPVMIHKKRFPRVCGDGKKTIAQLLATQPENLKGPNFIKWNLSQKKLKLSSVLEKGTCFETHIIKKRTPEYYLTDKFPPQVVRWGRQLLKDFSCTTMAVDFTSPDELASPEKFTVFELNACPGWTYVQTELGDSKTPRVIARHILTSYFGT